MITDDPVDRPLRHLRIVTALAVFAVVAPLAFDRPLLAAIPIAAGAVVFALAFLERPLRRRFSRRRTSVATLIIDLIAVLVALALAGVEAGDPASLLLALPLIAAGIRHAVLGVVVMWAATAFAVVTQLTAVWDGTTGQAGAPAQLVVALLVIALPASQLSQHAAERARAFIVAQASIDQAPPLSVTAPHSLASLLAEPGFDPMVYDRDGITQRLAARLADASVSVAIIGLDDLKMLNDLHGRAAGNALLATAVDRLSAMADAVDVGWLGGDELLVVVDERHDLGAMVKAQFGAPIDIHAAGSTHAQLAIGAATSSPGVTGPQLIRSATEAMVADRREQNARFLDAFDSLVSELSMEVDTVE